MELYTSTHTEWGNGNTGFKYLQVGTFSFKDNVQHNLLWGLCICYIHHVGIFKPMRE